MALLIFGVLPACKKVLEQQPKSSTYLQAYWKNAADCSSAIAGDYSLLRASLTFKQNSYYMYGDAVAQNYFTIQYNGDGLEPIQTGDFSGAYNVNSLGDWTRFYKVIAMSNTVLKQVSALTLTQLGDAKTDPQTFKNSILGQALFIRAYAYFMLTRVWGDVPLDTVSYDNPINAPQRGRSPKADIMKQIESDCHQAMSLLQWGYLNAGDIAVTANRGSVYALLAHLYLWRATMSDVNSSTPNATDVSNADTTITRLIKEGGYTLTPLDTTNYRKMFVGKSPESIFELNLSEDNREGSNTAIGLPFLPTSYLNTANNTPRFYVPPAYFSNNYVYSRYDTAVRKTFSYKDSLDVRCRSNFIQISLPKPINIKYSNVIYRGLNKTEPYLSNNMILFRLSDFKLLKAEIAIYKNDLPAAINILNGWRTAHGGSDSAANHVTISAPRDSVMHMYIQERGRELYLEGHIFWDLLRTRTYADFISGWMTDQRLRQEGFYWPVNPALFQNNLNLLQTPFWGGKL